MQGGGRTEEGSEAPLPLDPSRVELELEIPNDVRYIESIVEMVTRRCAQLAYHPRQLALNVPVALTEALSNAILRGNGDNPTKHVRIRAQVDGDTLIVEVTDEGAGFDLEHTRPDPTRPENLLREDGRGLFLMRHLMDRVERYDHHGNVVRMTLRRA